MIFLILPLAIILVAILILGFFFPAINYGIFLLILWALSLAISPTFGIMYYLTLLLLILALLSKGLSGMVIGLAIALVIGLFFYFRDEKNFGLMIAHAIVTATYLFYDLNAFIVITIFTICVIALLTLFFGFSFEELLSGEAAAGITENLSTKLPKIKDFHEFWENTLPKKYPKIFGRELSELKELDEIKREIVGAEEKATREAERAIERAVAEVEKEEVEFEKDIARELLAAQAQATRSQGGGGLLGAIILLGGILFFILSAKIPWLGPFITILSIVAIIAGIVCCFTGVGAVIGIPLILIGILGLGMGLMGWKVHDITNNFLKSLPFEFNFTEIKSSIQNAWRNFKNSTAYYILTGKWEYVVKNPWEQPNQGMSIIKKPVYALAIKDFKVDAKPKFNVTNLLMEATIENEGSASLENVKIKIDYDLLTGDEKDPCDVSINCEYQGTFSGRIDQEITIPKMTPGFIQTLTWTCDTKNIPPKIAKCAGIMGCPNWNCSGTGCPAGCSVERTEQRKIKFTVKVKFKTKTYAETKIPVLSKEEYYRRAVEEELDELKIPTTYVSQGPLSISFGYSLWPLVYNLTKENKFALCIELKNNLKGNVLNVSIEDIKLDIPSDFGTCELHLENETQRKTKIIEKIEPDKSVRLCCELNIPKVTAEEVLKEYYLRVLWLRYEYEFAAEKEVRLE